MGTERQRTHLEARVREYLRSASFLPGHRLPGERKLAEAIGVGRTALRPVLDVLVAEGALERKPQSGIYLKRRPLAPVRSGVIAIIAPIEASSRQGAWTHHVISAIERTAASVSLRPLILDQTPLGDDPCSIKMLAQTAADAGSLAAILI
ncbi:MAG: GntR family transcriptional regulator, partial [Chloroflexi bacterium]|nr:GntR family transcriptional regulator [Chloroflexota bacterium]